jgi:hypothetical protein
MIPMSNNLHNNQVSGRQQQAFNEGLEKGDLERLVSTKITVDEYKSKMGTDEEIVVLSFFIQGKEPALDLVNFIEKSYEWVVDADASSGEVDNGKYIVFVEIEREPNIAEHIVEMLTDLQNLTEHDLKSWDMEYFKPRKKVEIDVDSIKSVIPGTPEQYRRIVKRESDALDQLKTASGVKVTTVAPKNDFTESIRIAAGLR